MDEFATNLELLQRRKKSGSNDMTAQAELERRYNISIQEMDILLRRDYKEAEGALLRKTRLKTVLDRRQNDLMLSLSSISETVVTTGSPYMNLRDDVLAISDTATRMNSVLQFYSGVCRGSVGDESHKWAYCKETNKPLLPVSFYELALAFEKGDGEYYNRRLEEICRHYGTIDETGGYWIDKVSGLVLCPIEQVGEFVSENEIFQVVASAEVDHARNIEALFDNVVADPFLKSDQIVVAFLSRQTGMHNEVDYQTFLSKLMENNKLFLSKNTYERAVEKKRAKLEPGQPVSDPPYDLYIDKTTVCATVAAFFLAVQTSIPGIRRTSKKQGAVECHYSFDGYPLDSNEPEEDVGLRYVACLVHQNKSDQRPWNALRQVSLQGVLNNVKTAMKYLLQDPVVLDTLEAKRRSKTKSESRGVFQSVDWQHFLPPLIPFTVSLQNEEDSIRSLVIEYLVVINVIHCCACNPCCFS